MCAAISGAVVIPALVFFVPIHVAALGVVLAVMTVMGVTNHMGWEMFPRRLVESRAGHWLMGLLVIAFDQLREGFTALGGFSSRGLGRVTWRWNELRQADARAILAKDDPWTVVTDVRPTFDGYTRALAAKLEEADHVQA